MLRTIKNSNVDLFDSLLEDFFTFPSKTNSFAHDVIENENEFIIDFYLAGVKKEDVSINVENQILTVKAERVFNEDLNYTRRESFAGSYEKSYKLSDSIDTNKINASYVDGVLKVTLPKKTEKKKLSVKKIEIN